MTTWMSGATAKRTRPFPPDLSCPIPLRLKISDDVLRYRRVVFFVICFHSIRFQLFVVRSIDSFSVLYNNNTSPTCRHSSCFKKAIEQINNKSSYL
jgi:hypothetical protein